MDTGTNFGLQKKLCVFMKGYSTLQLELIEFTVYLLYSHVYM